jgi:SAM-dependent methyltransferase
MSIRLATRRSAWQRLYDHCLFPVNMWLGDDASARLGLTPLDHERVAAVYPHVHGRLLDVGCGTNLLVRTYGAGFGADIHAYPEADVRSSSASLPFRDGSFDTVALLACLNHITARHETLDECRRVLRPGGRVLVTMIAPWVGWFSHPIRRRHDPDQLERGMAHDEDWGLSTAEVRALLEASGFRLTRHERFLWGLNNLYVARIRGGEQPGG